MAEEVQFRLEKMVDELDDLERRGLFSRHELAEVVRRRRDFEYRLKRPSALKRDFLAYIDFETASTSSGAAASASSAATSSGPDNLLWRKFLYDFAGVRRILDIYRSAAMHFKGDVQLWFQYLEFCRAKRHGRVKQVLAQAIRFHPNVLGLWIYAAAWEFDPNRNVTAACAHMQIALRACPKLEDHWVEYLWMELTYINILEARKIALGEDKRKLSQALKNVEEQNGKKKIRICF